jgi:hypothetical protein
MTMSSHAAAPEPFANGPQSSSLEGEGRAAIAAWLGLLTGLLALAPAAATPEVVRAIRNASEAAGIALAPDALDFLRLAELGLVDVRSCRYCGCTDHAACQLASGEPCRWYVQRDDIAVCTNPACVRAYSADGAE